MVNARTQIAAPVSRADDWLTGLWDVFAERGGLHTCHRWQDPGPHQGRLAASPPAMRN